jgi:Fic family protein
MSDSNLENYRPSSQMVRLIGEIDEFKGSWRSLSRISPERLAALKKIATIESIGSSTRIEGASLTDGEVEALLSGLKSRSFRSRDEEEVAGYAELMNTIFENWQDIPLTENHIKQLHGILLKFSQKDEGHKGKYKTVPNHVEAFDEHGKSLGVVFKTASPFDTPFKMTELISSTEEHLLRSEVHPLLTIGEFGVRFLAIHPFKDGNGRLSRALTTLLLLKTGYVYVPFSSLESIIEANKESYYLSLRRTQATLELDEVDRDSWFLFFLKCLQKQKSALNEKIKREKILQGQLPALSIQILELARQHGSLKSSDIEHLTKESRSTIRIRLNELVATGQLNRYGKGPSTWYTLSTE